jgi:pyruvate/2-oxoglutarate dehydrogenase complex dihydrolipoamide acyltransferase (E2) component
VSRLQSLAQRYRVVSDPLRTERRLELLLLLLLALLLLLVVYGVLRLALLSAPATVLPAADTLEVGNIAPRFQPDAADSSEIRSRPLFWPGRRPQEAVAASPEQPEKTNSELKGVKLVGVFGAGDSAGIIVQGKNGKRRLLVGQEMDGWELASVNSNEVTLTRSGETRSLLLKQQAIVVPSSDTGGSAASDSAAKPQAKNARRPAQPGPRMKAAAARRQAAVEDGDELRVGGSISLTKDK